MSRTPFDNGFDQGFDAGYDIGYSAGFAAASNKTKAGPCRDEFSYLFQHLPPTTVIGVGRKKLLQVINDAMLALSSTTSNLEQVIKNMFAAIESQIGYSIIALNGETALTLLKPNEAAASTNIRSVLEKSDTVLVPSITHCIDMFTVIETMENILFHGIIAPIGILSDMFRTNFIKELDRLCGGLEVYDNQSNSICEYLQDNQIDAFPASKNRTTSVSLVGNVESRWQLILTLQEAGKVVIDYACLSDKLVKRTLPIGVLQCREGRALK